MYAVVGCNRCSNLWLVEGRQKTTRCSRCGKTHQFEKLKKFAETDDEDHARELRASILANRQGHGDAFANVDSFGELESQLEDAGVSDREYLEGSGLDADEVMAAGERTQNRGSGSQSRKETVLEALERLEQPTEADIVEYAAERDLSAEYVEESLRKLVQRGRVSENRGTYRMV